MFHFLHLEFDTVKKSLTNQDSICSKTSAQSYLRFLIELKYCAASSSLVKLVALAVFLLLLALLGIACSDSAPTLPPIQESAFPTLMSMPSTIPTPTPTPTYAITPTETAGWQTHRNEGFGFEFQYPENWTVRESSIGVLELTDSRGVKNISISSFDEATRGITYCEAYPQDTPRCEQIRVDDLYGVIDWGVDTPTGNALFDTFQG